MWLHNAWVTANSLCNFRMRLIEPFLSNSRFWRISNLHEEIKDCVRSFGTDSKLHVFILCEGMCLRCILRSMRFDVAITSWLNYFSHFDAARPGGGDGVVCQRVAGRNVFTITCFDTLFPNTSCHSVELSIPCIRFACGKHNHHFMRAFVYLIIREINV